MKIVVYLFALVGLFVTTLWGAGALGVGDFRLYYGPHLILRDHAHIEIKSPNFNSPLDKAQKEVESAKTTIEKSVNKYLNKK